MGKCNRCGKGGWFFKINSNGMCQECERIAELEAHELQLQKSIAIIQNNIATENKNYIDIKEKRQSLYDEIADQAKRDALSQIANEISLKRDELQAVIDQIDDKKKALENLLEQYSQSERATLVSADKLRKIQTLHKSMQYSAKQYLHQQAVVEGIMTDNSLKESEDLLSTTIKLKLHLMDIRELRKLYNQNNQIIQQLLRTYQTRYTTKANITIYQLMVIALEAELQNVLYNMKYSKLEKAIEDIKTITAKYQKISTTGNQSIAPTVTKFIGEIPPWRHRLTATQG